MSENPSDALGVAVDQEHNLLQLKDCSLAAGNIRHILVNKDATEGDSVAGAMIVQTMPDDPTFVSHSTAPNRLELVFEGTNPEDAQRKVDALDSLCEQLQRFSEHHGIGVTTTNITNDLFHKTFADVG